MIVFSVAGLSMYAGSALVPNLGCQESIEGNTQAESADSLPNELGADGTGNQEGLFWCIQCQTLRQPVLLSLDPCKFCKH